MTRWQGGNKNDVSFGSLEVVILLRIRRLRDICGLIHSADACLPLRAPGDGGVTLGD